MSDPDYVLGTDFDNKNVKFVIHGDPNQFSFTDARQLLGVDQRKELKNCIIVRDSREVGGDKYTNYKIVEWPSSEYLSNLSKKDLDNYQITRINWVHENA